MIRTMTDILLSIEARIKRIEHALGIPDDMTQKFDLEADSSIERHHKMYEDFRDAPAESQQEYLGKK